MQQLVTDHQCQGPREFLFLTPQPACSEDEFCDASAIDMDKGLPLSIDDLNRAQR
ncbi:MAG: hypothetical protein ABI693_13845 [Bryobacteraceae bacterium]